MTPQRHLVLAAAALLSLGAGSASATVAQNGEVATHVSASAGDGFANDSHHDTWTNTPHDLATSASAFATSGANSVAAQSAVSAHWASASAGSVTASMGWTVDTPDVGLGAGATLSDSEGAADWSYKFTAEGFDEFNLAFDLQGTGNTFGLGGWNLLVSDETGNSFDQITLTGIGATGVAHDNLTLGHTYTVALFNNNAFFNPPQDVIFLRQAAADTTGGTGSEQDRFDWSITGSGGLNGGGVPEPSTWALAILGFGLTGGALRRRARPALAG
jgi:PEP-CTERM motif